MRQVGIRFLVLAMGLLPRAASAADIEVSGGGDGGDFCLLVGCTMTGPILYANGTATAPAVASSVDSTAGLFFTAGTVFLQNQGSGDQTGRSVLGLQQEAVVLYAQESTDALNRATLVFQDDGGNAIEAYLRVDTDTDNYSKMLQTPTSYNWAFNIAGAGEVTALGVTSIALQLPSVALASLGTPADGTIAYCSDCNKATPCTGSGDGALAKRINGAWDCD